MNAFLEQFVTYKFKHPGKALDLGAGKFFDVACLKQMGWICFGVDKTKGIDLEDKYLSPKKPFDLVFSNYVIHKLKNPRRLVETAYNNLKPGGWVFLHTFDKTDKNSRSKLDKKQLVDILKKQGFIGIKARVFNFYDNEPGHNHWHKILEVFAQKSKRSF